MSSRAPDIYALDPAARQLLQLETFRNKFVVNEFVQGLSAANIAFTARQPGGALDPKPYIRTFESALTRLQDLREAILQETKDVDKNVKFAETQFAQRNRQLEDTFRDINSTFTSLQSRISDVGKTAITIGIQLEAVEKQRKRATDAKDLFTYYLDFVYDNTSDRLDALLLVSGDEGKSKCAIMTRRLLSLAKDLDTEGHVREGIEKYGERLEKDLLKGFDKAYRRADLSEMREYAKVLHDFNGGTSVVQVFVNQHDFFIVREKLESQNPMQWTSDLLEKLSDPDAEPLGPEPSLLNLCDEVLAIVQDEGAIIGDVFPHPSTVIQVFLQRIFQQSIQGRLEGLMTAAEQNSNLTYLRVLQSSRSALASLVDDLKGIKYKGIHGVESMSSITGTLDQNLDDLFVPYLENSRYIGREIKSLQELYSSLLYKYNGFHSQRKSTKNKMLEKFVNQVQGSTNPSLDSLKKLAGLKKAEKDERIVEPEFIEQDGLLELDIAKRMLKWHAEAIGRAVELTPHSELAKDAQTLMIVLFEHVGKSYVETVLDYALEKAKDQDAKGEPDYSYLHNIKVAVSIIHLLNAYINTALIPLASSSLTVRRDMTNYSSTNISALEKKVNNIFQTVYQLVISSSSHRLSKQRKNDFKLREDDGSLTNLQTEPCRNVTSFWNRAYQVIHPILEGRNNDLFFTELGLGLHSLLLEHFKKFTINAAGGLILTKDIALYYSTIETWKIPALSEPFELLRELGNVFVVKPDILRSLLREGVLARIQPSLIAQFLRQRDDYNSSHLYRLLDDRSNATVGMKTAPASVGPQASPSALNRAASVASPSDRTRNQSTTMPVNVRS